MHKQAWPDLTQPVKATKPGNKAGSINLQLSLMLSSPRCRHQALRLSSSSRLV